MLVEPARVFGKKSFIAVIGFVEITNLLLSEISFFAKFAPEIVFSESSNIVVSPEPCGVEVITFKPLDSNIFEMLFALLFDNLWL